MAYIGKKPEDRFRGLASYDTFTGDGSNDVYIVKDATIPAGTSLEVMSGNKIVVQNNGTTGDVLRVSSSTGTSLDATITVLEDV